MDPRLAVCGHGDLCGCPSRFNGAATHRVVVQEANETLQLAQGPDLDTLHLDAVQHHVHQREARLAPQESYYVVVSMLPGGK